MRDFIRLIFLLLLLTPSLARAASSCAALEKLQIAHTAIASAEMRPAGKLEVSGADHKTETFDLPAFCRVIGIETPTSESKIGFEVWLPANESWNGRFEGVGNHAFLGAIAYDGMAEALKRGSVAAGTDAGHIGDDLSFGFSPEKTIDWSYRAVHLTTALGKLLLRDFYGRSAEHAYFVGCDSGGQEGLTEALRYPEDYDGIVAGNPAADRLHEVIGYLGQWRATHTEDGKALLPFPTLQLLTKSAIAACDTQDGVKDGVIEDPAACRFDPAAIACKQGETSGCLTPEQVAAAKSMYAGIRNPRTHAMVFPGWAIGSEAFGDSPALSWSSIVTSAQPRRADILKNFVFSNPDWDWKTFDMDTDVTYADRVAGVIAATSDDLHGFLSRNGKLLMYMGWSDPILPAADVIDSYKAKIKAAGGTGSIRLYMVPGMGHCGGGPGTTDFDMTTVLERWVEQKEIPQRILATRPDGSRSRPLCPYPQTAHWSGHGSTEDAENFVCKAGEGR